MSGRLPPGQAKNVPSLVDRVSGRCPGGYLPDTLPDRQEALSASCTKTLPGLRACVREVRKTMPKGNPCGRAYFCELKLARA